MRRRRKSNIGLFPVCSHKYPESHSSDGAKDGFLEMRVWTGKGSSRQEADLEISKECQLPYPLIQAMYIVINSAKDLKIFFSLSISYHFFSHEEKQT